MPCLSPACSHFRMCTYMPRTDDSVSSQRAFRIERGAKVTRDPRVLRGAPPHFCSCTWATSSSCMDNILRALVEFLTRRGLSQALHPGATLPRALSAFPFSLA